MLFLLEGGDWRRAAPTALAAESAAGVREIEIGFVRDAPRATLDGFDCLLAPDGQAHGSIAGPRIRIGLLASGGERLEEAQARTLLAMLGNLSRTHAIGPDRVRLLPDSDPRRAPALPGEAHALKDLLLGRGIIR